MTEARAVPFTFVPRWPELLGLIGVDPSSIEFRQFVAEAEHRDQALEDWLGKTVGPALPPFTLPGGVSTSTSPPWTPWEVVAVSEVRVLLGTAGSSTTTVEVQKDGTAFETVNLSSSTDDSGAVETAADLAPGDLLTVEVTAAGTGAQDLVVVLS